MKIRKCGRLALFFAALLRRTSGLTQVQCSAVEPEHTEGGGIDGKLRHSRDQSCFVGSRLAEQLADQHVEASSTGSLLQLISHQSLVQQRKLNTSERFRGDNNSHQPPIWETINVSERHLIDRQLNLKLTTKSMFQIAVNTGSFDMTNQTVKECLRQYESVDEETLSLLDLPYLSCMTRTLVPESPSIQMLTASTTDIGRDAQLLSNFPSTAVNVASDPNPQRQHIFVVGPESSGTHFMQRILASCYADGPVGSPEFFGNGNAQIPHISQPEGSVCSDYSEPVLQSFPAQPELAGNVLSQQGRFFVNPVATIADYKKRGEKIQFAQMVRNPQISFFSKMHGHCSNSELGLAEHKLAFELMVNAMEMPEVSTFCYEELMEKGPDFLKQELQRMGIDTTKLSVPIFRDGNSKYSAINQIDCDGHGIHELNRAYVRLCPHSPHTKALERQCGF